MAAEPGFDDRFAAVLGATPPKRIAIALSGGPDSTALLHLACDWAEGRDVTLTALTVDHGLRPESGDEARAVSAAVQGLGIDSHILTWDGAKPVTGIQSAARDARYALMLDWCQQHGFAHLLLGHHADDQAATLLMRLQHGSGVDGLGGMAARSDRAGVTLLRPLLDVRKQALIDWLIARRISWVTDPSNASDRYERNRLNHWLDDHDTDGLLTDRLVRLAARARRTADALDAITTQFWEQEAACSQDRICLGRAVWLSCPEEIRLRLLVRAIAFINNDTPNLGQVEALLARLPDQPRATLGTAMITLSDTLLTVERAPKRQ